MPAVGPGITPAKLSVSEVFRIFRNPNHGRIDVVDCDLLPRYAVAQQGAGAEADERQFLFRPWSAEGLKQIMHWTGGVIVAEWLSDQVGPIMVAGRLGDRCING